MQGTSQGRSAQAPALLVIGATGGIGGEVARQAIAMGWRVHALSRRPVCGQTLPPSAAVGLQGVVWIKGDAMHLPDVQAAAQGMDFILHAANPPGYRRWRELALPMLTNAIEAARHSGARLVLPGNVYNYGPDAGATVSEASPQQPLTRKGQVRVEMEAMLRQAACEPVPVKSLVVRAGDFFGAHAPSSWLVNLWLKPGRPLQHVWNPGKPGVGHAWAYLPDLAEAMLQLMSLSWAEPHRLADAELVHFAGHWLPDGLELAQAMALVCGRTDLPVRAVPWRVIRALSLVVPVLKEMMEMRYLWEVPMQLDNRKLITLLGREPHTPLNEAMRHTLRGLGCL